MGGLFGRKKKKPVEANPDHDPEPKTRSAPPVKDDAPEENPDKEVLRVKVAHNRMKKNIRNVQERIVACEMVFEEQRQNRDKAKGTITFRKLKMLRTYELQLMQMEVTLASMIVDLETAAANQEMFQGLKAANSLLNQYKEMTPVERIEELVDDTRDMLHDRAETTALLCNFMPTDAAQGASADICDVEDELMVLWGAAPEEQADDDAEPVLDAQLEAVPA